MGSDDPKDGWFGDRVAAGYDRGTGPHFEPEQITRTVDLLASLAAGGPALELAVGTGRIACPLAARGIPVHGIELSRAMAARTAGKPGSESVTVTIGDMTDTRVAGTFTLAYLVFNTINNVTTQDGQVACFRNAAAHLADGGQFVIEVGVPALRRLPPGQDVVPFRVEPDGNGGGYAGFDHYDVVTQAFTSNHVTIDAATGQGEFRTIPFRYVWPSELDLMARLAGLTLTHRWEDWSRTPFTAASAGHVSVWTKVASGR